MDLKKIEKFIDKQKVSFICSIDNENYPNVKAMLLTIYQSHQTSGHLFRSSHVGCEYVMQSRLRRTQ